MSTAPAEACLPLAAVTIGNRHRRDLGDVNALTQSAMQRGGVVSQ